MRKLTFEALYRSITIEVEQYGITVNCFVLGYSQTRLIYDDMEKPSFHQFK